MLYFLSIRMNVKHKMQTENEEATAMFIAAIGKISKL